VEAVRWKRSWKLHPGEGLCQAKSNGNQFALSAQHQMVQIIEALLLTTLKGGNYGNASKEE
jgi:hypothetical protein